MAKNKKEAAIESGESMDLVIKSIGRNIENALVGSARNILNMNVGIIPSSLRSLNRILGKGGFRLGRIAEFYGDPMSGKSTLALDLVKNCQKLNGTAAYIDAEQALDLELLENMGIDADELTLVQGFSGEDNIEVAERILRTGELDIMVIDSVSALVPQEELDAAVGDAKIALHARLMSRAIKKLAPVAARTNTLLVFINQIRFKTDGYGDPRITTGGNALKFFSSYRIQISGGIAKGSLLTKNNGEPFGQKSKIELVKNKLSAPHRECEVNLIYGFGFDEISDAVNASLTCGLIYKKGSWYAKGDTNLGQGIENLVEHYASDLDEFEVLLKELDGKLNIPAPLDLGELRAKRRGIDAVKTGTDG